MITTLLLAITVAVALGLLEAAWTGPGRGGPTNTWLGIFAILIVFLAVTFHPFFLNGTFPYIWWIPALAILEELVHLFTGYPPPYRIKDRIFKHWSRSYIGFNIYPYITFPILTAIGQIIYYII